MFIALQIEQQWQPATPSKAAPRPLQLHTAGSGSAHLTNPHFLTTCLNRLKCFQQVSDE